MRIKHGIISLVAFSSFSLSALAEEDVDIAVAEVRAAGVEGDGDQLRQQIRLRLQDRAVCSGNETCQKQLRQRIRACAQLGKKQGVIKTDEDAADVAAAVMLRAQSGDGDLVQRQLQRRWRAGDIHATAEKMQRLQHRKRWQRAVKNVVARCSADESCTAEHAQVALTAMNRTAERADADPRRTAATVQRAMRGAGTAQALQQRLRQKLQLQAAGSGSGQQKRNRYRNRIEGESRRGGGFGGQGSGGQGKGISGSGQGKGK